MMRLLIVCVLVAVSAVPAAGQSPFGSGVTPPVFVIPNGLSGGGHVHGPIYGPVSCTVPAYAFQGAETTGLGGTTTPSVCLVVNGSAILTTTASAVTSADGVSMGWGDAVWNRQAANWTYQRNGASAQRASWANAYTSATNNESFSIDWQTQANVALVGTRTAATGTIRPLVLLSQTANGGTGAVGVRLDRGAAPFVRLGLMGDLSGGSWNSSTTTSGAFIHIGEITSTSTSGAVVNTAILPAYNQTSGTAANTDLLINRTQTAVGSGAQRLIDAQVGGVSQFSVSNTGVVNGVSYSVGGVAGVSATCAAGIASMTVTNGLITAITCL